MSKEIKVDAEKLATSTYYTTNWEAPCLTNGILLNEELMKINEKIDTGVSSALQDQLSVIRSFEGKYVTVDEWKNYMDAVAVPIGQPKRANRRISIKIRGL